MVVVMVVLLLVVDQPSRDRTWHQGIVHRFIHPLQMHHQDFRVGVGHEHNKDPLILYPNDKYSCHEDTTRISF